jgi:hypothetical protein
LCKTEHERQVWQFLETGYEEEDEGEEEDH